MKEHLGLSLGTFQLPNRPAVSSPHQKHRHRVECPHSAQGTPRQEGGRPVRRLPPLQTPARSFPQDE